MALTFVDSASWATAGTNSGTGFYKDVTFTGVAVGDLLIVGGLAEGANYSSGVRSASTQSGTTSAWTLIQPAATTASDADALGAYATASSSGTVVVRVQVRPPGGGHMGAAGIRIPSGEWTGTPTTATFASDADGQVSVVLPGGSTYTVAAFVAEYNASAAATGVIPAGGTNRVSVLDSGAYTVFVRTWTAQTSGTRNYGPGATTTNASLSGLDATGFVIAVPEAGGGPTQYPVSGAAAATSAATAAVTALLPTSGTVASSSGAAGAVTARLPTSGSAAATSGAAGAIAARLAAAGSATSSSSATGAITARLATAGVAAVASAAFAAATVISGGNFESSGTAEATSDAFGAVTVKLATAATAVATSDAVGAVTARLASAGSAAATSGAFGDVGVLPAGTFGTAVSTSGAFGAVTLRASVSGLAQALSGARGAVQGSDIPHTPALFMVPVPHASTMTPVPDVRSLTPVSDRRTMNLVEA